MTENQPVESNMVGLLKEEPKREGVWVEEVVRGKKRLVMHGLPEVSEERRDRRDAFIKSGPSSSPKRLNRGPTGEIIDIDSEISEGKFEQERVDERPEKKKGPESRNWRHTNRVSDLADWTRDLVRKDRERWAYEGNVDKSDRLTDQEAAELRRMDDQELAYK